jgi:zinc and cadmium transporter
VLPPVLITAIAIASAAAGVWLSSFRSLSRRLVPFGGGVLLGVTVFWMLPELAEFFGWLSALGWLAGGFLVLGAIDRFVYPVCPSCSPVHDHGHCDTALHGFAGPLLIAAALHSAVDGWSVAAAHDPAGLASGGFAYGMGAALTAGIGIHKIPEGLALGVITRAAMDSPASALFWCAAAESATLAGAALETVLGPYLGPAGLHALLALAAGSFLYLAGHAVHGEFRRSGTAPALVPALTGVAGSSVLRLFLR